MLMCSVLRGSVRECAGAPACGLTPPRVLWLHTIYLHPIILPDARLEGRFVLCPEPHEATTMADAASSSAAPDMAKLSQERYERALLGEINKLQEALHEERTMIAAQKSQMTEEKRAEKERKANESEKASRLQAMEAAILQAQKEEQREFNRKVNAPGSRSQAATITTPVGRHMRRRGALALCGTTTPCHRHPLDQAVTVTPPPPAPHPDRAQRQAADKRMEEREQAAAQQRTMEAKRQEQQRQLAAKLHQETMERAAEERRQAEESKRLADERKERKLHERLAAEHAGELSTRRASPHRQGLCATHMVVRPIATTTDAASPRARCLARGQAWRRLGRAPVPTLTAANPRCAPLIVA